MNASSVISSTPEPPYYAVIFTSKLSVDTEGCDKMAERMVELARGQSGYLGIETARGDSGVGITVSYWKDMASIQSWKAETEHRAR